MSFMPFTTKVYFVNMQIILIIHVTLFKSVCSDHFLICPESKQICKMSGQNETFALCIASR